PTSTRYPATRAETEDGPPPPISTGPGASPSTPPAISTWPRRPGPASGGSTRRGSSPPSPATVNPSRAGTIPTSPGIPVPALPSKPSSTRSTTSTSTATAASGSRTARTTGSGSSPTPATLPPPTRRRRPADALEGRHVDEGLLDAVGVGAVVPAVVSRRDEGIADAGRCRVRMPADPQGGRAGDVGSGERRAGQNAVAAVLTDGRAVGR